MADDLILAERILNAAQNPIDIAPLTNTSIHSMTFITGDYIRLHYEGQTLAMFVVTDSGTAYSARLQRVKIL